MSDLDITDRLNLLAIAAADTVRDGMVLGLGTGSTASAVIRELGARCKRGLSVTGVATSVRTAELAISLGIPLIQLDNVSKIDLGIDGADEIDPRLNLIKGGGGALLIEKLVALQCREYLAVSATEKLSPALGTIFPLPIEIIPVGHRHTLERISSLGLEATLRLTADGSPLRTDSGNLIVDARTGPIADPKHLGTQLKTVTGVVDHGLFVDVATHAMLVDPDGEVTVRSR